MSYIEAKVVVLGSQGVGKTSVVYRYIGSGFNKGVTPTIGASFFTSSICMNNQNIKLQVWDTAGQERFRAMAPMYYRGANAAIVVYDITIQRTFEDMKTWILEIQKHIDSKIVLCILGNKSDLSAIQQVDLAVAEEYAAHIGAKHFITSALSNEGIESVFMYIAEQVMKQLEQRRESCADMTGNHSNEVTDSVQLDGEPKESATKSKCCSS